MNQSNTIITQTPDSYTEVIEIHQKLNQQVQLMHIKINGKIDRSQDQFLYAYQNHLRKLKIELEELKRKLDIHQKEITKNEKIMMLEKEIVLFREQALKLYNRLEQKTQQAQIFKMKTKQLQKSLFTAEKQAKDHLKYRKLLQGKLLSAQQRIIQLQLALKNIPQIKNQKRPSLSERKTKSVNDNRQNESLKMDLKRQIAETSVKVLGQRRKSTSGFRELPINTLNASDGQLKDWFLQCVKAIKKDVAQRKNSRQKISLDYVTNLDEFMMVDKLKLLEKFMQNEKLLTWMYEKIFPSQSEDIKKYLLKGETGSNAKTAGITTQTLRKGANQSQYALPQLEQFFENIPSRITRVNTRLSEYKSKRGQIRSRVHIKDGKLNLTHF